MPAAETMRAMSLSLRETVYGRVWFEMSVSIWIHRRDRTNGELMDQVRCQKERIEAQAEEIRRAREEIDRLKTVNEVPSNTPKLASALIFLLD